MDSSYFLERPKRCRGGPAQLCRPPGIRQIEDDEVVAQGQKWRMGRLNWHFPVVTPGMSDPSRSYGQHVDPAGAVRLSRTSKLCSSRFSSLPEQSGVQVSIPDGPTRQPGSSISTRGWDLTPTGMRVRRSPCSRGLSARLEYRHPHAVFCRSPCVGGGTGQGKPPVAANRRLPLALPPPTPSDPTRPPRSLRSSAAQLADLSLRARSATGASIGKAAHRARIGFSSRWDCVASIASKMARPRSGRGWSHPTGTAACIASALNARGGPQKGAACYQGGSGKPGRQKRRFSEGQTQDLAWSDR